MAQIAAEIAASFKWEMPPLDLPHPLSSTPARDVALEKVMERLDEIEQRFQIPEHLGWKQRLLKKLRDPVWQGVAAIVSILALLVTAWGIFQSDRMPTPMPSTTEATQKVVATDDTPPGALSPTSGLIPTPEPFEIQYIAFDPPPPAATERVKIFACTRGYGGVGITLKVAVNSAPDGSDGGDWQVLKELGVPCFNQVDAPVWNTKEWKAGTYFVKVEAKGPDDPNWEHPAVLTTTYTLSEGTRP